MLRNNFITGPKLSDFKNDKGIATTGMGIDEKTGLSLKPTIQKLDNAKNDLKNSIIRRYQPFMSYARHISTGL